MSYPGGKENPHERTVSGGRKDHQRPRHYGRGAGTALGGLPDFLCQFKTLYVDSSHWPIQVERARVHKNMVILKLQGVTDVNSALAMRNAVLYIDRKDVQLPEGSVFPG